MVAEFPKNLNISIAYINTVELPLILGIFQEVLNFSYEPIWYGLKDTGKRLENGSWTGIIGKVQRGEIDLATNLIVKEERTEVMDFSFPYIFNDVTFMTNKPTKSKKRTFAFVDAFSVDLWIAVVVFYIFFSLMFYQVLQGKESCFELMMKLFGSLLGQSFSFTSRRTSKRFLFISWIIGVFLLINSFRNTLLAFWSVPSLDGIRTIKDLADAVKKGTCIANTHKDHIYVDMFLNSTNEDVRIIGQSMLQHNEIDLEVGDFLRKYKGAFVAGRLTLNAYKHQYYLSDESFFFYYTGLGIRKGFCCISALNKVIVRMLDTYRVEEILWRDPVMKWGVNHEESSLDNPEEASTLHLQDIVGAFYFLFIGYALSLVTLIAEILHQKVAF